MKSTILPARPLHVEEHAPGDVSGTVGTGPDSFVLPFASIEEATMWAHEHGRPVFIIIMPGDWPREQSADNVPPFSDLHPWQWEG